MPATVTYNATVMQSGGDYSSLQGAVSALACDLTSAASQVFSISAKSTPTIADGAGVTGLTSGATGTCCHVNVAGTQIFIKSVSGTFVSGETVKATLDASKTVTLSSAGSAVTVAILIDGYWTVADTTPVIFTNYTTSSAHFVAISTSTTSRHNGRSAAASGRNSYRLLISGANTVTGIDLVSKLYNSIVGLEISAYTSTASGSTYGINTSGTTNMFTTISQCIIHDCLAVSAGYGYGIRYSRSNTIQNNIIYNVAYGIYDSTAVGTAVIIENNTIYNYSMNSAGYGIRAGSLSGTGCKLINNLAVAGPNSLGGGASYLYSGTGTVATNGSSDTTGSIQYLTYSNLFTSTVFGSENLHLKAGAAALDVGTDLSTTFTTDIDGDTRPTGAGTWDLGADEYHVSVASFKPAWVRRRQYMIGGGVA